MSGGALAPPARPSVPVLLSSALGMWAFCALCISAARVADDRACIAAFALISAAGLSLAIALICGRARSAACVVVSCALGAALGLSQAMLLHSQARSFEASWAGECEAVALADSDTREFGSRVLVAIGSETGRPCSVQLSIADGSSVLCGDVMRVRATLVRADWEHDSYSWNEGVVLKGTCESAKIVSGGGALAALRELRRAAIARIGSQDADHALVQALACGYRGAFKTQEGYADYQSCGVAHLVAISGAHLVIVTALVASLLKALHMPRKPQVAVLVLIMSSYFVLSGMPVSALRAAIMSSTGLLALLGRRRPSSLNALGIGIFAIVGSNPQAAVSASFALSALSTLGIVIFAPLFQHWARCLPVRVPALLAEPLALTAAASIASQPFACSMFNLLPLASPLANVVLAPLFPPACLSSLLAGIAMVAGIPAGDAVAGIALVCAHAMNGLAGLIATMPYAAVPFSIGQAEALALSAALALSLWLAWERDAHIVALAAACLLVPFCFGAALFLQQDAIVMLNVGQGDAFLVMSHGSTLLIDTGNQDRQLLAQLGSLHVSRIDAVLVTHGDDDHCGSLDVLERSVQVGCVLVAKDALLCPCESCRALVTQASRCAREVIGLSYGDEIGVGAFRLRVVWPHSFSDEGGNADSICLVASYDGDSDGKVDFKALFTGDAEAEQLEQVVEAGDVGDVDLLKVGHHGSRNGMTDELARALSPEVALIGVGADNRYGHPAEETLEALDSAGAAVYRSDRDGEVACMLGCDMLRVASID